MKMLLMVAGGCTITSNRLKLTFWKKILDIEIYFSKNVDFTHAALKIALFLEDFDSP